MRLNNHSRHLKIFVVIALLFGGSAYAANWYVRPSAAGSNSGVDWNNAWSISSLNGNQSRLSAGDTVWFAGGSYSAAPTITKSGSSGNPITYYRVRSNDGAPVAAAGWNSSFDSQVNFGSNTLDIEASWITISGRITDGFYIKWTSGGDACRLAQTSGSASNVNLSYFTFIGPYSVHGAPAGYGINWAPGGSGGRTNIYVGYCTVRGFCEAFRSSNWNGVTIEHCLVGDTYNDSQDHEDTCYSYACNNVIWRYNTFYNSPNDGFFSEDSKMNTNWYFYGNVVYNYLGWMICTKNDTSSDVAGPMYIYNNVFQSPVTGNSILISNNGTKLAATTYVYNNIFINAQNQLNGIANCVSDYNAYSQSYLYNTTEPHSITFTYNANLFTHVAPPPSGGISESPNVGDATGNFQLTAAGAAIFQNKGKALTPTDGSINYDGLGNLRGATGGWFIGAFQYLSGQPAATPQPPAGLRITGS